MFVAQQSVLVVIDVQGKLAHLVHNKDQLFQNIIKLIHVAQLLDIPVMVTEQSPQKIGETIPEIKEHLVGAPLFEKACFSCFHANEKHIVEHLKSHNRKQVIVCGIEAHVCVYQSVEDLKNMSFEVGVVADAVSSRTEENKNIALNRMERLGSHLISSEMIATELLVTTKHPKFKDVLNLIR